VLVISHDVFNERSGTVIGMAITSQPQRVGMPLAVQIEGNNLLSSPAILMILSLK
jgi:mRNA interferase MazF